MSVVLDILRNYRAPREVFRRRLGNEVREDRALIVLMLACLLIFVAQWPRLQRIAIETGQELQPLIGGTLLGWLFIMPLAAYAIGTLTHFVARMFGGRGTAYGARFAFFWALLAASPLWLFYGLVAGFIGPGRQLDVVGILALGAFILFWALDFTEAEWG